LRTQFPGGITDERLRGAITSARRILLRDREMVFSAVPKVGYQLLSSEDVVDASDQDVRSMRRKAHVATAKLASATVTDLPPEKQAKQSARMAIFAVVSGCFDFHRTPKLTDRQSATKQIGEGVRGIVDHMTHKR
jgi:hypothetical protein